MGRDAALMLPKLKPDDPAPCRRTIHAEWDAPAGLPVNLGGAVIGKLGKQDTWGSDGGRGNAACSVHVHALHVQGVKAVVPALAAQMQQPK